MKLTILLVSAIFFMLTSCKPCEAKCKFNEGDEIEMIEKSFLNNNGQIVETHRHGDCSCYYTVKYSNMMNFTVEDEYDEFELEAN